MTHRGADSAINMMKAERLRLGRSGGPDEAKANEFEEDAKKLLWPAGPVLRAGGEAIAINPEAGAADPIWRLLDKLEKPDSIGLDASESRLKLIDDARVLDTALDASQTIQAANSLERMLAHQMAAAHGAAMKLIGRALNDRLPPVEMVRLANAAARLMDVYQGGMLTIQKVRTGGKQTVVVQHVSVSDGGKAVIAGNFGESRGPKAGEG